jgi:cystathionine beta-lyase
MGRNVVYNPLHIVNGFYKMDFDQLESVIGDCKVLILSSPHNPAGIVWGRQTLCQLAEICSRHHVLVISDEIHSEMVFPTHDAHIPFAVISPAAAANSITFMAPSKTFNIAGIISSYAIVPDDDLRRRFFTYLEAGEHNQGSIFAYTATQAAYEHGEAWRRQMIDYVMENVRFVNRYLKDNIPQIRVYMPEASFLIWLDCRDFRLEQADLVRLFVNSAGLALNDGTMFGHEGNGYMRLNVGCPRSLVAFGLDRLKVAIEKNHSI